MATAQAGVRHFSCRLVTEASRPAIDSASHSLTIDWPDSPVWLDADPARLAQILSNLLTNSVKYMHPGGLTLVAASDGRFSD